MVKRVVKQPNRLYQIKYQCAWCKDAIFQIYCDENWLRFIQMCLVIFVMSRINIYACHELCCLAIVVVYLLDFGGGLHCEMTTFNMKMEGLSVSTTNIMSLCAVIFIRKCEQIKQTKWDRKECEDTRNSWQQKRG